jgi:TetR/AcrR family transcriptional regulator
MSSNPKTVANDEKSTGRIRQKNQQAILAAAAEEFACYGFKGTSMNSIAQRVGLPKANLHYYFNSKEGLYIEVMRNILELWDSAFDNLHAEDDPATAMAEYIRAKMEFSRRQPQASKIFAMEIISGGECMAEHFNPNYMEWFHGRAGVFPVTLIFLLWSSTQHYADFSSSIARVSGRKKQSKEDFAKATVNLTHIILKGCGLTPPLQP